MIEMNWQNPDYSAVLIDRQRKLARLRADPTMLPAVREYYKRNPAAWVNDWSTTFDPRNPERGIPSFTPFVLMPFQVRWLEFIARNWRLGQYNLTEKSRETGLSWLAVSFSVWLCIFHDGVRVGFGSYKAELVDELGNPGSLLEKMRILLRNLPREFRGGWIEEQHSKRNQIDFPATRSAVSGAVGDNIGRGDRTSIFFVDEAAHLEHPILVDQALSATTNCRADISSVRGYANSFAQKVHEGKLPVFRASWRDDCRKDAAWEKKMRDTHGDTTFGQEFDADYMAGEDGQVLDGKKLSACVDAHKKLGIRATGQLRAGLDIATVGRDLNALAIKHGVVLKHVSVWKEPQVKQTTARALRECHTLECTEMAYDAIAVGYSVGEFVHGLTEGTGQEMRAEPFVAGESPENPTQLFPGGTMKNENMFANKAAQGAWNLRRLVDNTYRAVELGDTTIDRDEIFSIDSETVTDIPSLLAELSRPTYSTNTAGKITVDKAPPGTRSPNRYDAVMIAFFPQNGALQISEEILEMFAAEYPALDPYSGHLRH